MIAVAVALALLLGACSLYYLAAAIQGLRSSASATTPGFHPPVSILKPVKGIDTGFGACIRSHAVQDYPDFELLFATKDPADPAIAEIHRLAEEFPRRRIEVFVAGAGFGPNEKVNSLERLRRECRNGLLVISDSDIRVQPDYLRRVVSPLADPGVGLVTCLYRGVPGGGLPSLLEALWISTDFQPSVLMARLLDVRFALGATIALRRPELDSAGGFAPIAPYLADDYQLGKRISDHGLRIALCGCVVETLLGASGWAHSLRHRLRWYRTLRVCRPSGYAGMLVTFAVPLSLAALILVPALWPLAACSLGLRLLAAFTVGVHRLRDPVVSRYWFLLPLSDLLSFGLWMASLLGRKVVWRGEAFRLERDGRLTRLSQ